MGFIILVIASVFLLENLIYLQSTRLPHLNSKAPIPPRRAYATFLCSRQETESYDDYFVATRVLTYQLLHDPETRTNLNIPLVVIVPPHIPNWKRNRLREDGADVVEVQDVESASDWVVPGNERYRDQFTKLRIFELVQYDQILYIDSDTLLVRCLDGIWNETVVGTHLTTKLSGGLLDDLGELPNSYSIIGVSDSGIKDYMNGGFFMLHPNIELFDHYVSVLNTPGSFDPFFMEQALLNHVHSRDGQMPWAEFEKKSWSCQWPTQRDIETGCATLHDKFWIPPSNTGWTPDWYLTTEWFRMKGKMEGYWQKLQNK